MLNTYALKSVFYLNIRDSKLLRLFLYKHKSKNSFGTYKIFNAFSSGTFKTIIANIKLKIYVAV